MIGYLFIDIITPVFTFGIEVLKLLMSFVKLILYIPSIGIIRVLLLIKDAIIGTLLLFKSVIMLFKSFIVPISNSQNREVTLTFI